MSFSDWYETAKLEVHGIHTVSDMEKAYTAGLLRAAEIAEGMEGSWADLEWNQVCRDIAAAIRKES